VSFDEPEHTVVVQASIGEILDGRWRIEERVGKGAMGAVFKARDVKTLQSVAVKILSPDHCRKPKVLARFEREASILTGLSHPNIVKMFGHGRRGLLPYIVMEFLKGKTLSEVAESHGSILSVAQVMALLKQVKEGLSFLHHNGLVHRDIKPQNIFLTERGRVAILDLGVVRDAQSKGLTRPGAMVGTPYYMAPEQILGVDDVDLRVDVYALGAMTFELLTGRPPFAGTNNFEVLYGHKNTPPPDARTLVKTVPEAVSRLIKETLSKKRELRPQSVDAFWAALETAAALNHGDLARAAAELYQEPPTVFLNRKQLMAQFGHSLPAQPKAKRSPTREDILLGTGPTEGTSERTVMVVMPRDDEPSFSAAPTSSELLGQAQITVAYRGRSMKALIEVDGAVKGTAPATLSLTAGLHELTVSMAGFRTTMRSLVVTQGRSVAVMVSLEPL
jgi:serine/threonine protein kinase